MRANYSWWSSFSVLSRCNEPVFLSVIKNKDCLTTRLDKLQTTRSWSLFSRVEGKIIHFSMNSFTSSTISIRWYLMGDFPSISSLLTLLSSTYQRSPWRRKCQKFPWCISLSHKLVQFHFDSLLRRIMENEFHKQHVGRRLITDIKTNSQA